MGLFDFLKREEPVSYTFTSEDGLVYNSNGLQVRITLPEHWQFNKVEAQEESSYSVLIAQILPPLIPNDIVSEVLRMEFVSELEFNDQKSIDWRFYFPDLTLVYKTILETSHLKIAKAILNHLEDEIGVIAYCVPLKNGSYLLISGKTSLERMKWYSNFYETIIKSITWL